MRPALLALCLLLPGASGCAEIASLAAVAGLHEPVRSVTLRVSRGEAPVEGALVRAIAIDAGSAPLPVTLANVEEYYYAVGDTAVTDSRGLVTLRLHEHSPHAVEVLPWAFESESPREPDAWRLDADGRTLTPLRDSTPPCGLVLNIER